MLGYAAPAYPRLLRQGTGVCGLRAAGCSRAWVVVFRAGGVVLGGIGPASEDGRQRKTGAEEMQRTGTPRVVLPGGGPLGARHLSTPGLVWLGCRTDPGTAQTRPGA